MPLLPRADATYQPENATPSKNASAATEYRSLSDDALSDETSSVGPRGTPIDPSGRGKGRVDADGSRSATDDTDDEAKHPRTTPGRAHRKEKGGKSDGGAAQYRQPRSSFDIKHARLLILAIVLGPFGTGLSLGYTRAAQGSLLCARLDRDPDGVAATAMDSPCAAGAVSSTELAGLEHVLLLGAVGGGLLGGWLVDALGRRGALRAAAGMQLTGWLGVLGGEGGIGALVGRGLTGAAAGVVSVAAPTLVVEVAPDRWRGPLTAACHLALAAAVLMQQAIALAGGMAPHWRMLAFGGAMYSVVTVGAMCWAPESPRWLVSRGQTVVALKTLAALRGLPHTVVQVEDIGGGVRGASRFHPWHLLTHRRLSRPLLNAIGLMALQQLGGINLTLRSMSYAGGEASDGSESQFFAAFALVQVVGCLVCMRLLSEGGPGRRATGLVSLAGMALSNAAIATSRWIIGGESVFGLAGHALQVIASLSYVGTWAAGVGTVPWLVAAESFPQDSRGTAMGMVAAAHWSFALDLSLGFQPTAKQVGVGIVFVGFALVGVVGVALVAHLRQTLITDGGGTHLDDAQDVDAARAEVDLASAPLTVVRAV